MIVDVVEVRKTSEGVELRVHAPGSKHDVTILYDLLPSDVALEVFTHLPKNKIDAFRGSEGDKDAKATIS